MDRRHSGSPEADCSEQRCGGTTLQQGTEHLVSPIWPAPPTDPGRCPLQWLTPTPLSGYAEIIGRGPPRGRQSRSNATAVRESPAPGLGPGTWRHRAEPARPSAAFPPGSGRREGLSDGAQGSVMFSRSLVVVDDARQVLTSLVPRPCSPARRIHEHGGALGVPGRAQQSSSRVRPSWRGYFLTGRPSCRRPSRRAPSWPAAFFTRPSWRRLLGGGCLLRTTFLAAAFLAGVFLAGTFLAGVFAGAFLAGADFFAGPFRAGTAFVAGLVLASGPDAADDVGRRSTFAAAHRSANRQRPSSQRRPPFRSPPPPLPSCGQLRCRCRRGSAGPACRDPRRHG